MFKTTLMITGLIIGMVILTGVAGSEEIHVCTENWPPYYYEINGEIKGISTAIVKAVLKEAGLNYTINVYPWARAYDMALNDKNVLIYTIARTPEREKLFKWVGEITPADSIIAYKLKKRGDIIVKTVQDLKKYKIGVVKAV